MVRLQGVWPFFKPPRAGGQAPELSRPGSLLWGGSLRQAHGNWISCLACQYPPALCRINIVVFLLRRLSTKAGGFWRLRVSCGCKHVVGLSVQLYAFVYVYVCICIQTVYTDSIYASAGPEVIRRCSHLYRPVMQLVLPVVPAAFATISCPPRGHPGRQNGRRYSPESNSPRLGTERGKEF